MKKVHFVGIGGTGISAIARLLLERNWQVSGSDMNASPYFDAVTAMGARTILGHDPDLAIQADLVVRSSAVRDNDPEVKAAMEKGIPVLKRSEFLPMLTKENDVIAIAGSHGKTTTTAMLIHLFLQAKLDINFILGADIKSLGKNAQSGSDPAFIIEADEYDYMFLGLSPLISLITNIEYDHPDFFATPEIYTQAFVDFANKTRPEGKLLVCADDAGIHEMLSNSNLLTKEIVSYGFEPDSDYQIVNYSAYPGGQSFQLSIGRCMNAGPFEISMPGRYNVLNATAALAAAHLYGLDLMEQKEALHIFPGTSRRFDLRFENENWLVFDDYGHHPRQLEQTIKGARQLYPDHTIWAVWEPHTVSRTKHMHNEFSRALEHADQAVILKLFGARENADGYKLESFINEENQYRRHYLPENEMALNYILKNKTGKDLVIVFSAGKGPEFSKMLSERLSKEHNDD